MRQTVHRSADFSTVVSPTCSGMQTKFEKNGQYQDVP